MEKGEVPHRAGGHTEQWLESSSRHMEGGDTGFSQSAQRALCQDWQMEKESLALINSYYRPLGEQQQKRQSVLVSSIVNS